MSKVSSRASSLASSFAGAQRGAEATAAAGPAPGPPLEGANEADRLEAALLDGWERGRAAWPDVGLEAAAFAAYLGQRAPPDADPVAWLAELRVTDMFLACACAAGLPQAVRAFDDALLGKMSLYLRSLRPTPELVEEARQDLLEKLFVGAPGRLPKIRQYGGRGALEGWVRVAALRTALNLLEAEKAGGTRARDEANEVARAIAPGYDPELELIQASYRGDFIAAFHDAMTSLPQRDRNLLRFTFVERLTPARIAVAYGVHRTTVMRWIEAAQDEVVARTRARLMERLRLTPSECDGLIAVVKSRIQATLTSLMKTTPERDL